MPWSCRNVEIDGRPAQVLIDDRFRAKAPIQHLPRLAWFAVYCQSDPGNAFWNPAELEKLDAIEDDLLGLWEQLGRGWAAYVLRIATRGLREYYVYTGQAANFGEVLTKLKTAHPDYKVEYEETQDPSWSRYNSYLLA